ncbi:PadR family transcriptional regulator [Clostridium sp. 'deep sea']|uniref:PadR family transcriptional regulator n=1 Tax=Clostridium sp. 'deep sea' TaxID=2779445 RepID=UPI0018968217|nr:PadR family transcriptional regulator [Clostridium sp. 'deep sea']QOR33886.1 PadR family transcriptional regulator [Clostridium sp. 'deep sea']
MNIQFKKGVLELCVLSLLSERDHYGYELVKSISEHMIISEGTIYPLLRRLTKDKYCDTYLKESTEGPPRKYYRLTSIGLDSCKNLKLEWDLFTKNINEIVSSGRYL